MRALACDVLGLDWTMDLGRARAMLQEGSGPRPTALQGNIDPNVLFAPPTAIRAEARRVLERFGAPHADAARPGVGHVFNLGHGISQFTPPEHVAHLVDEVHAHSRRLRAAA